MLTSGRTRQMAAMLRPQARIWPPACFTVVPFSNDPTGLPATLTIDGSTVTDLSRHRATFLQQTAHETVTTYAL